MSGDELLPFDPVPEQQLQSLLQTAIKTGAAERIEGVRLLTGLPGILSTVVLGDIQSNKLCAIEKRQVADAARQKIKRALERNIGLRQINGKVHQVHYDNVSGLMKRAHTEVSWIDVLRSDPANSGNPVSPEFSSKALDDRQFEKTQLLALIDAKSAEVDGLRIKLEASNNECIELRTNLNTVTQDWKDATSRASGFFHTIEALSEIEQTNRQLIEEIHSLQEALAYAQLRCSATNGLVAILHRALQRVLKRLKLALEQSHE